MRQSGFSNYSLFRNGTHVISYAECDPDVESCLSRFSSLPVAHRWREYMNDMIVDVLDEAGGARRYHKIGATRLIGSSA